MIRFPRMHIAESVLNRIQNTLEGTGPLNPETPPPVVPDPTMVGMSIDAALETPLAPAAAVPGNEEQTGNDMVAASVTGSSPGEAALVGNLGV